MNLFNIINKNELEVDEMCFVVEKYILENREYVCEINLLKGLNSQDPFFGIKYQRQLQSLNKAYDTSAAFFHNKQRDEKIPI